MQTLRNFFYNVFRNIASLYRGWNLFWQVVFIGITYVCVNTGFDWFYYSNTRSSFIWSVSFPSAILGFLMPLFLPIGMFLYAKIKSDPKIRNAGYAVTQAGILGLSVSSFYKVFTGRMGPHNIIGGIDLSHMFRFGILRGGAFQGWPSSHTATAFAMSMALVALFPKNKFVKYSAIIYAVYIGLGVSTTIHWFSDFVAGAILGTVIGLVVGKSFLKKV